MQVSRSSLFILIVGFLIFTMFLYAGYSFKDNNHNTHLYGAPFINNADNLVQLPACTHLESFKLKKNGKLLELKWIIDTAYYKITLDKRHTQGGKGTVEDQMVWATYLSKNMLDKSVGSVKQVVIEKKFDYKETAEFLVKAVQNMPYYLVEPGSSVSDGTYGCIPNIPFGLLFPVETIVHFGGDCDSKTLLLYCMLRQLGYEVAIVGSEKNNHVLLGLANVPVNGSFIEGGTKKYYLWETSDATWIPGDIPKKLLAYDDLKIIYNK